MEMHTDYTESDKLLKHEFRSILRSYLNFPQKLHEIEKNLVARGVGGASDVIWVVLFWDESFVTKIYFSSWTTIVNPVRIQWNAKKQFEFSQVKKGFNGLHQPAYSMTSDLIQILSRLNSGEDSWQSYSKKNVTRRSFKLRKTFNKI